MITVQRSGRAIPIEASVRSIGSSERASFSNIRSGHVSHATQAIFFPIPKKDDVISHPVKELNSGSDSDF